MMTDSQPSQQIAINSRSSTPPTRNDTTTNNTSAIAESSSANIASDAYRNNETPSTASSSESSNGGAASSSSSSVIVNKLDEFYSKFKEEDRIRVLLAMAVGLENNLVSDARLDKHVKSGRVKKSFISLRGKFKYNLEIIRRAEFADVDKSKFPRPTDWENSSWNTCIR